MKNLFDTKLIFDESSNESRVPDTTPCTCQECSWSGIIVECGVDYDQEGWEYPVYEVLVCPKCGSFAVDI